MRRSRSALIGPVIARRFPAYENNPLMRGSDAMTCRAADEAGQDVQAPCLPCPSSSISGMQRERVMAWVSSIAGAEEP